MARNCLDFGNILGAKFQAIVQKAEKTLLSAR